MPRSGRACGEEEALALVEGAIRWGPVAARRYLGASWRSACLPPEHLPSCRRPDRDPEQCGHGLDIFRLARSLVTFGPAALGGVVGVAE